MRVWQAYNVGEGMDIEGSWNNQDVSGLEGIGEWTKEISRVTRKKYQTKGKYNVTEFVNILLAALNLLVLPRSRQSKRQMSTWTLAITL